MFDTQPIEYMSCGPGSSLAADFWATSRIDLPASIAVSIALIDFGRPTKSGITMCGNTTTSRRGKSGYWTMSEGGWSGWDIRASVAGGTPLQVRVAPEKTM